MYSGNIVWELEQACKISSRRAHTNGTGFVFLCVLFVSNLQIISHLYISTLLLDSSFLTHSFIFLKILEKWTSLKELIVPHVELASNVSFNFALFLSCYEILLVSFVPTCGLLIVRLVMCMEFVWMQQHLVVLRSDKQCDRICRCKCIT